MDKNNDKVYGELIEKSIFFSKKNELSSAEQIHFEANNLASIGSYLKTRREQRGISTKELSNSLRIGEEQLDKSLDRITLGLRDYPLKSLNQLRII